MRRKEVRAMLSKGTAVLIILIAYLLINLYLGIRVSRQSAREHEQSGIM